MNARAGRWLAMLVLACGSARADSGCAWPRWEAFKQQFLTADGRINQADAPRAHTVSEAQAYALFFALVAQDRKAFGQILAWTENNLAQGDLTRHLPAWQWGQRDDGSWGVLDANPASDADLWLAYALGEAGRLWGQRRYRIQSLVIGRNAIRAETQQLPGLGLALLPGPRGFYDDDARRWRLNPSYAPLQVLRRLAVNDPDAPWPALVASSQRVIVESARDGYAPDWIAYDAVRGFAIDERTRGVGSYDAIRVYLWAGMLHEQDPARAALLDALRPMAARVREAGVPPEKIESRESIAGTPQPGFAAALLPLLTALDERDALQAQVARLRTAPKMGYYNQALTLFGHGWHEGRYRFADDGALELHGSARC